MENTQHKEIIDKLNDLCERMDNVEKKLAPIHDVFTESTGFFNISRLLFKGIIIIGATVGVVYGFFRWLKN